MKIFFIHSLKLALVTAKAQAIIVLIAIFVTGSLFSAGARDRIQLKPSNNLKSKRSAAQVIEGVVTDEQNAPLPGVSILIEGTTKGTLTNSKGRFKIMADPDNDVLVFSMIGYESVKEKINGQKLVNIVLKPSPKSLNEVVVVGYGSVKKGDLTGSVSIVGNKDISKSTSGNLLLALEGQAAGVNIQQNTGDPGNGPNITIRGANSLSSGVNQPLYVIDGMILSGLGNQIDLSDVQSVQVLKDASATAIYGSRGANGVIIIVTKHGATGKPVVTYDGYTGAQEVIKKIQFLNADQFKQYYLQSRANAKTNTKIDPSINNSPYNTNWSDQVFRMGVLEEHTISISGGTDLSKYYTSVNYYNEQGVLRNTDFSRLSARFNGDQSITSRLKVSQNILLAYTTRNGISDELVSNGIAWALPTSPVTNSNGTPTTLSLPFARTNPRTLLDDVTNDNLGYRLVGNFLINYNIAEGLSAKINLGTDLNISHSGSYTPKILAESSFLGSAADSYGTSNSFINENTLNYDHVFNRKHSISAVAGVTFQDNRSNGLSGSSSNYVTDSYLYNNLAAGSTQNVGSGYSRNTLLSYLGRVNYGYDNKYLVTISGRYDGASVLSTGHKYAFFPSGAVAWRMSKEDFLKDLTWLSDFKLRASWGRTGSQNIGAYSTFATFANNLVYLDGSTSGSVGFLPNSVANTNLHWEETDQLDLGYDLSLFNNRIQITSDYYNKDTKGLLLARVVPPSSGYSSSVQNIGEVSNKGFELGINTENFTGPFSWSSALNFSLNRAKVINLGNTPNGTPVNMIFTSSSSQWFPTIVGQQPYVPYGFVVDHIDKTTGTFVYKDLNHDGKIDASDETVLGSFQPKFIFGFTNNFTYKNFDLSIFIQGSVGNDVFVDAFKYSLALNGNNNILASVFNGAGTIYPIPNADYGYNGGANQNSSALIFSGTYVRVKNVTLGYTLKNVFGTSHTNSLRIYLTGTNLLTFDKNYPWYDPEVSAGPDVITGWDRGGYPNNKSVVLGLKVKF